MVAAAQHDTPDITEFFPTPPPVIGRMLAEVGDVLRRRDVTILEPSAGKGDILAAICNEHKWALEFDYTPKRSDGTISPVLYVRELRGLGELYALRSIPIGNDPALAAARMLLSLLYLGVDLGTAD